MRLGRACAALLFVTGMCFTLWTSNANSILQLGAPDHLRGRIVSLYLWAFAGLAPIGGLLAGWLTEVGGTPLAFAVAGLTGPRDDRSRPPASCASAAIRRSRRRRPNPPSEGRAHCASGRRWAGCGDSNPGAAPGEMR